MPIYEYRCKKGHNTEVMQRFTDDPITTCEVCGLEVQRVFHPIAVHFKGSGFYNTDYGTRKRSREKEAAASESSKDSSSSKDVKKSESGSSSNGSSSANGSSSSNGDSGSNGSSSSKSEAKKATASKRD